MQSVVLRPGSGHLAASASHAPRPCRVRRRPPAARAVVPPPRRPPASRPASSESSPCVAATRISRWTSLRSSATAYGMRMKRDHRVVRHEAPGMAFLQRVLELRAAAGNPDRRRGRASRCSSPAPSAGSPRHWACARPRRRRRRRPDRRRAPACSASATQSSNAQFMPWPWNGTIACAASPISTARSSRCQRSR